MMARFNDKVAIVNVASTGLGPVMLSRPSYTLPISIPERAGVNDPALRPGRKSAKHRKRQTAALTS